MNNALTVQGLFCLIVKQIELKLWLYPHHHQGHVVVVAAITANEAVKQFKGIV